MYVELLVIGMIVVLVNMWLLQNAMTKWVEEWKYEYRKEIECATLYNNVRSIMNCAIDREAINATQTKWRLSMCEYLPVDHPLKT